ncbi:MAG: DUF2796 domain-containing protein [Deltaproteobacteria bacterium]|nr:DUF2796 domain-containing protein [Deltaproteobacteria bacterium]
MKKGLFLLALCPLFFLFLASGRLSAQGETHEPHVHGVAHLNVSVGTDGIELDLESPLASFISFEHEPSTPEQRKEFENMDSLLKAPDKLISFPAAYGCSLKKAEVAFGHHDDGDHHDHDDGDHHDHDGDHHDHDDGDHHDHDDAESEHHDGDVHRDADASYVYACSKPPESGEADLSGLFKSFPLLTKLEVQIVTPNGQNARELAPGSTVLKW